MSRISRLDIMSLIDERMKADGSMNASASAAAAAAAAVPLLMSAAAGRSAVFARRPPSEATIHCALDDAHTHAHSQTRPFAHTEMG